MRLTRALRIKLSALDAAAGMLVDASANGDLRYQAAVRCLKASLRFLEGTDAGVARLHIRSTIEILTEDWVVPHAQRPAIRLAAKRRRGAA